MTNNPAGTADPVGMDVALIKSATTAELHRIAGILQCERMLYARPPDIEAKIDERITAIELELHTRKASQ